MSYKCFSNKECPYFPCHEETEGVEFNCMFCYCPLYALGPDCGGHFRYLPNGIKDCSNCNLPHQGEAGWEHVNRHIRQLLDKVKNPQLAEKKDNGNTMC